MMLAPTSEYRPDPNIFQDNIWDIMGYHGLLWASTGLKLHFMG